ncbi:MAG: beta-propeller fold lactonase family protein, partial [Planctomycetota bacterium]
MESETTKYKKVKFNFLCLFGLLLLVFLFSAQGLGQHFAYVTNAGDFVGGLNGDLSVVDLATNTTIATIPVGDYPQGVAINPAGTAVYVANTGSSDFTVIDAETYETTTIAAGPSCSGVAVHPDGTRIYLTNTDWWLQGTSTVSVIDRATNTVIDNIYCGDGSCGVAVHPDGTVAYVTNAYSGTVAVFDTDTHEVIATIPLETLSPDEVCFPVPITVHPEGKYIYAANRMGPTFWAIDTVTYETIKLPFGQAHVGIAVNPEGSAVYIPDIAGTTVDVINAETFEPIMTIDGQVTPLEVSVHPDGTRVYITNARVNTVAVIDAATGTHIASIPVGVRPHGVGTFIGPGVPRLLKEDAMARLEAVKESITENDDGVGKPDKAIENIDRALESGTLSLFECLWSETSAEEVDPRRLDTYLGDIVFKCEEKTVKALLDAIKQGEISNVQLRSELLAITDEVLRADRVLAAVAIDDAIVAGVAPEEIEQAQESLETGDVLVKTAAKEQEPQKKAPLLYRAIKLYQDTWETA